MPQPRHRIPGARRRFTASAVAAAAIVSGLGIMGIAMASQPLAPVMPAPAVAAAEDLPRGSAAGMPPRPSAPLDDAMPDLGDVPPPGEGDSWQRGAPEAAPTIAATPPTSGLPTTVLPAAVLPASQPVSLAIPAIAVDSPVRDLGQDARGGLEVPQPGADYDHAAWYRYSPTPGELGPAVLLGHVDSAANGPSVFFRLGELEPGDEVTITRADGSVAVFTVDAVHRYAKDDFPTARVYGDIDHAGLRILTCGGAFDRAARSYVDNIVVFASLV